MKWPKLILASLLSMALFNSCLRDQCTSERTYVRFEPVYKSVSEVRVNLTTESPRALHTPGKIYSYENFLFINEKQEGIHVFDNTDPANPKAVAFWNIPGNVDMAIRGNYLYVDQYVDLVTIDISDIQKPNTVCRAENVFPLYGFDPAHGYIVDYKQTSVTEKVKCDDYRWSEPWFKEGDYILLDDGLFNGLPGKNTSLPANVGIAGSFARFGIADQFLYTVDNSLLRSWSISNASCPVKTDSAWVGWNAETIFPWKDRLFLGSQTGVFIFNNSNPAHPVMESSFSHASGCDPVVCDDNYAYVTIHDGTTCNGTFNQLDIIDIRDIGNTTLLKSYPMKHPAGLSITDKYLFLCDDGLKVFDKTNPLEIKELSHLTTINAYDVIAFSDSHLMLVGDDGFFQYDVSDPSAPRQLSLIPVSK